MSIEKRYFTSDLRGAHHPQVCPSPGAPPGAPLTLHFIAVRVAHCKLYPLETLQELVEKGRAPLSTREPSLERIPARKHKLATNAVQSELLQASLPH